MLSYYVKNSLLAFGGTLFAVTAVYLIVGPEEALLRNLIRPAGGRPVTEWTRVFAQTQEVVIGVALFLALVWHAYALVTSGRAGDDRILWIVFGVIAVVIALIWASRELPPAAGGAGWAISLSGFNATAAYWAATILFTPATHKYDPYGSHAVRGKLVRL